MKNYIIMKEEQLEEIEILESIYPDEIERINEESISILINLECEADQGLIVEVEFPEDYPESVIPVIKISPDDTDPTIGKGEKYSYKLTNKDCSDLRNQAIEIAEENLGMPSIFTIVSAIKENAESLYEARIRSMEVERLKKLEIEEAKEQEKFKGTPVTKESFNAWRLKFRAEMGLDKEKERINGRYTGREIFDKGLYKEEDEEEEEEAE